MVVQKDSHILTYITNHQSTDLEKVILQKSWYYKTVVSQETIELVKYELGLVGNRLVSIHLDDVHSR